MAERDTKSTAKAKSSTAAKAPSTKSTATKTTATKETSKAKPTAKSTATAKSSTATAKSATKETAAKPEAKAKTAPKATEKSAAAKPTAKEAPAKTTPKTTAKNALEKPVAPAKEKAVKAESKPKASGKSEKAKATNNKKPSKGGSGGAAATAAIDPQKLRAIIISATSVLLVAIIVIGIVFGTKSCNKGIDPYHYNYGRFNDDANYMTKEYDDSDWNGVLATTLTDGLEKGTSRAPQVSEYLGTVTPVKPVKGVVDEHETYGVRQYPYYGRNLTGYTVSERDGLIKESHALAPSGTWKSLGIYNGIDSEGYLLKNGARVAYSSSVGSGSEEEEGEEGENISGGLEEEEEEELETGSTSVNKQYTDTYRRLYKHTAALTMYGGGLSDDEPRIIKKLSFISHVKVESTQITGLYAPAGEVIKIEMSKDEYYEAGGLVVIIGQTYNLWQHVSMETAGSGIKGTGLCRMPDIVSRFILNDAGKNVFIDGDKVTMYVGSFFGGPIYLRPIKNNAAGTERNVSVTISGGVRYQHFILGATTEEEYNANKASTAPYFDLEVYDAVRFTTHKYASSSGKALKDYSYQDCTDSAILWDKISQVSKRVAQNGLSSASSQVYIIGDCYVAAGAAFANPGRNGVVCPPGWLPSALNYNAFVNGGSWGTMHEYNHCWQGYGLGNGGEVTNNATTLVAYSLYTRISRNRTMTGGLSDWSRYTDPAWAMSLLLPTTAKGNKAFDLSAYATLLHNIGQDSFLAAARGGREAGSTVYFNNLVNASHYDMTYYFTKVLNLNVGSDAKIGWVTQDAINAAQSKNYPMFVPVSSVYQVGRSILYDNEKKYITTAQPFAYGCGEFTMDFNNHNGNGTYSKKNLVIPDGFTVSVVGVTQPANGKVEMLGNNYVKYTPNSKDSLYSGNFRVKLRIIKDDRAFIVEDVDLVINLKQSAGSQLYRTTYVYETADAVPSTDSLYNAQTKQFNFGSYASTERKLNVCTQETNTQIWAAGRNYDDATYIKDSKNYRVMPVNQTLQMLEGTMYFSSAGNYRFTLKGRGKATLYLSYDNGETWEKALTINRTSGNSYNNNEFSEHSLTANINYVQFKVVLLVTQENDFFGIGVTKQNADGSFPAFNDEKSNASAILNADVHKALLEESAKKFETEYRYKTEYRYSYTGTETSYAYTHKLVSVNRNPWDDTRKIEFMFDGNVNTWFHTQAGEENYITEAKPLELIVDIGSVRKLNRITFNGYINTVGNNGMVKSFKLYGSTDGVNYKLLTDVVDSAANAKNMSFNFDEAELRYYKLVVTKTDNGRYFAMNSIVLSYMLNCPNGKIVAPNEPRIRYVGNSWTTKSTFTNFGITYVANAGDSVEYHFNGSRFAYFVYPSDDLGTVDIYVDGKLVARDVDVASYAKTQGVSITQGLFNQFGEKIAKTTAVLGYMYTGDALSSGEHVVKIVGKTGKFNVDSFAYWA